MAGGRESEGGSFWDLCGCQVLEFSLMLPTIPGFMGGLPKAV